MSATPRFQVRWTVWRALELARELCERRLALRRRIVDGLSKWMDHEAADRLAGYLLAVQQGLAVQARDGASEAALLAIRDEVMAGLAIRQAMFPA